MKKRIARGSGTRVDDVNKLINQFNKMKKAMNQVGMMQRNGNLNEESLERMMNNAQSQMSRMQNNPFGKKFK